MEARLVNELPREPGWQFEPKWDGFRCLAFRAGDEVELRAKSGKTLSRYFPEVVAMLGAIAPESFIVDGELAIPIGQSLSFDALQARLHPAESRVREVASETPTIFILFDCLMSADEVSLLDAPLTDRRAALEDLFDSAKREAALKLTPYTREYRDDRQARLHCNAPGGPSRWSNERSGEWQPLRPELVVEVRYDQVTADRFRHGTRLIRWRPDKAPEQCTFDQMEREARPAKLVVKTLDRSSVSGHQRRR